MRVFRDQQRVPEQSEIFTRVALAFDHILDLVGDVVDAKRGVEAGGFQRVERVAATAGDFADQREILFADGLRELVNTRGEKSRRAVFHMLDGIHAETVEVGIRDPVLIGARQRP